MLPFSRPNCRQGWNYPEAARQTIAPELTARNDNRGARTDRSRKFNLETMTRDMLQACIQPA